jgi:hypothetical protein
MWGSLDGALLALVDAGDHRWAAPGCIARSTDETRVATTFTASGVLVLMAKVMAAKPNELRGLSGLGSS